MSDEFIGQGGVGDPARKMWAITPHDTDVISPIPKALRFDADGEVTLRAADSEDDVVINVVAGEIIPVRATFIRDTGTDSIVIHGLG